MSDNEEEDSHEDEIFDSDEEEDRLDEDRRSAEVVCPIRLAYMANGATVDDVRAVVERDPEALMRRDASNWLPLHWAIDELDDMAIFRYLVEVSPRSFLHERTGDDNNDLPFDLACDILFRDCHEEDEIDAFVERIRIMLEKWPEAAWERDEGQYLLERLSGGCYFSFVRCIDEVWPEAIGAAYENGTLLLHKVLDMPPKSGANLLQFVKLIVARRPKSVRQKDGGGLIPLECVDCDTPRDVVMFLARQGAGLVDERDGDGRVLLHRVLTFEWDDEDLLPLLEFHSQQFREASRLRTNDGLIPLSVAAKHGVSLQGFRALANMWQGSVRSKDSGGRLPIHLLFMRENWSDPHLTPVARYLIKQYPQSLYTEADEGDLPLHLLMKATSDQPDHLKTQLVELLVNAAPKTVSIPSSDRAYPLHDAVRNGFPLESVRRLVNARPDSCQFQDKDGWTALHIAVTRRPPSPSIVRFLVRRCPQSVQFVTRDGSTALVLALAQSAPPMDLVRFLVEQDRDALLSPNPRGMIPVHIAAAHNSTPGALQYLIEQAPASLRRKDRTGSLALHTALRHDKSLDFVRLLVEGSPESVGRGDDSGSLPLHVLLMLGRLVKLDVVRYLVEHQPPGRFCLEHRNCLGHAPLHVAAMNGVPPDVLFFLVRKGPELIDDRRASKKRKGYQVGA